MVEISGQLCQYETSRTNPVSPRHSDPINQRLALLTLSRLSAVVCAHRFTVTSYHAQQRPETCVVILMVRIPIPG